MKQTGWLQWLMPMHRRHYRFSSDTEETGFLGEKIAASFLHAQGFKILTQRYRVTAGEIDLVCRDGNTLVFVEVKSRSSVDFGQPSDFVDANKQRRLSKAALSYLRLLNNPPIYFRFDIVEVLLREDAVPECRLIMNAFDLAEPYIY